MSAQVIDLKKAREWLIASGRMHDSGARESTASIAKVYIGLVYCMAAWEDRGMCGRPLTDAGIFAAPSRHSRRSEPRSCGPQGWALSELPAVPVSWAPADDSLVACQPRKLGHDLYGLFS